MVVTRTVTRSLPHHVPGYNPNFTSFCPADWSVYDLDTIPRQDPEFFEKVQNMESRNLKIVYAGRCDMGVVAITAMKRGQLVCVYKGTVVKTKNLTKEDHRDDYALEIVESETIVLRPYDPMMFSHIMNNCSRHANVQGYEWPGHDYEFNRVLRIVSEIL